MLSLLWRAAAALAAVCFAAGAYVYLTLPDVRELRTVNPQETAFQALRAREARAAGKEPRRVQRWVGYDRISPHLQRAVIVAEDAKFWQHEGVDYAELRASIETNIERREFVRGGSTITQQLAKNLYLSPSKDPLRKVRELLIARRLEAELPKRRILELYLNVVEWGDGIYGAEAAARTHFRKSASQLAPGEAALLAAALVNPRLLDPSRPSARLRRRQQIIARRMGIGTAPSAREASPRPAAPPRPDVLTPSEAVAPVGLPAPADTDPAEPCSVPPCP